MTAQRGEPAHGQGEREQFLRLISSLSDTYRPEGVLIWLTSRNRSLGDIAPRDYIAANDWQPLLDEADRLAGGPLG